MKKIYIQLMMLVAMVVAGAAITSCQKEEAITGRFSMTVKATKGGGNAKALSLDGSTLNATWAVGDEVKVYKGNIQLGTLTALSEGERTTLGGDIEGTIATGDDLTLKFCSPDYTSQDGTLETIATTCDYATATVRVTSVDNGKISTGNADFQNQQAIVKFTLTKMADNSALNVTSLIVNDGTNDYTVTPSEATNVLFVAIPATGTVTLSSPTNEAGISYSYEKTGAGLSAGRYYEITVKMSREVNLTNVTANTILQDGDVVTGTLGGNYQISIADGATVTLNGANINNNNSKSKSVSCAGITCVGDATINLYGGSIIHCSSNNYPGIQVGPSGKTLTIQGTGSLNAQGGSNAAGIGGGSGITCGNISLVGGAITACGGEGGAGIGGGAGGSCGSIDVRGGEIIASGGEGAAGIGSGSGVNTACGNIHLYGGSITACGGDGAAGIGSGSGGTCGGIEIEGGTITATGGNGAAGIGSGQYGSCGNIEIQGGEVSATGNGGGDDIGAGYGGECGIVTLPTPEGALSGLFSVSDDKQVRFSRGNLLSDGTFAANQYTYGDYFYASNSYNGPAGWDALTTDEWNYLYQHSTFGFATVNGIHGLIILPNNYTGSAITAYDPEDGSRELWNDNTYSGDAWTAMENNGVVFLPAAGYLSGDVVQDQGYEGNYLTSSSGSFPVCFKFENQQALVYIGSASWNTIITANESGNGHYQYSVRFVRTN